MQKHAGTPTEQKFTEPQTAWLQMIRDHIATSFRFDRFDRFDRDDLDDLDDPPFDAQGGLGKMHAMFVDQLDPIIAELNENLVA